MFRKYSVLFFVLFFMQNCLYETCKCENRVYNFHIKADGFHEGGSKKEEEEKKESEKNLEKMNFTKVSKELFKAYLNQKGNDKTEINGILKKVRKSKLYHLDRAFRYGTQKLGKSVNLYKRLKLERAVWNISQDFACENRSIKIWPVTLWTVISVGSFLIGGYSQIRFKTLNSLTKLVAKILTCFGR